MKKSTFINSLLALAIIIGGVVLATSQTQAQPKVDLKIGGTSEADFRDVEVTTRLKVNNLNCNNGQVIVTGANGYLECGSAGGTGGTGTANYAARWTGTSTLGTGVIYDNGTSVGIGTTNPQQQLQLTGSIRLPMTTNSTAGVIYKDGSPFIHNFQHPTGDTAKPDGYNTFIGLNAGNFTMGSTATEYYHSSNNTGVGNQALSANTTGFQNTANGFQALHFNTIGAGNTANGYVALYSNKTGNGNTALGYRAGRYLANGSTGRETGDNGLYLGSNTKASANGTSNEIVIGYNAVGKGSNTIVLGGTAISDTYLDNANRVHVPPPTVPSSAATKDYVDSAFSTTWLLGGNNLNSKGMFGSNNDHDIGIKTNNIERMTILASNGNVGIGTTNPGAKLDVIGSSRTGSLMVTGLGGGGNKMVMADNSGNLYSTVPPISVPAAATNGATLRARNGAWVANTVLFNNGTNIGIGTTNPASAFQVYGNSILGKISGYPFRSLWTWDSDHSGYYSGIGYLDNTANNQKLYMWWIDNVVETNINSVLNIATPGHTFDNVAPNSGRVIGAKISSSGISYFNGGNVGIGTTNPEVRLQVIGQTQIADGASPDTRVYGTFGVTRAASASNLSYIVMTRAGQTKKGMGIDSSNNWIFGNPQIGQTLPANEVWMTITSTGRVGIGTTNPGSKLQIYQPNRNTDALIIHTAVTNSDGAQGYGAISFQEYPGKNGNYSQIRSWGNLYSRWGTQLSFHVTTGEQGGSPLLSEAMRINNSAYVGIGTTNPQYKLDINGEARSLGFVYESDIRLKKDVRTISGALDKVLALRGVNFTWKESGKPSVGLIAQEVEKIFPELVSGDDEKGVQYGNLVAPLIEAVKEQQKIINNLEARLSILEIKNKSK